MSYFLFFLVCLMLLVIVFQLFKTNEHLVELIGAIKAQKKSNKINAALFLVFLVIGLTGVLYCNEALKGKILGEAASEQGINIDKMIYVTITLTAIVFFITQILLFWFVFKYRSSEKRKSFYFTDSTKLELIWTIIPAAVLTVIVGFGIYFWINITGAAPKDAQVVEVTGKQFGWEFRYPGKDGILGKKYFKNIDEANNNPLGQLWDDPANRDDIFVTQEMHVVVGKPVHLIIGSQDVIHDVGLVHFRMKMDAVPGTPTTMWFTPRYTTEQMKTITGNPNFAYEISCDQMCGIGHSKMRGVIVVESQADFDKWMAGKEPQYKLAMQASQPAPIAETKTAPLKILSN